MRPHIRLLITPLLLVSGLACVSWPSHAALGPAATARKWCETQTLRYLKKRGYEPYNWSATTYIEDDNYVTKGIWRIDIEPLRVECTTKKNGRKTGGHYKILNIDISEDAAGGH